MIYDDATEKWRPCESNDEILEGTRQVHQKWCGKSEAKKQFAFAELVEDEVGPIEVEVPQREGPFNAEDAKKYVPKFEAYLPEIQQRFIDAHNNLGSLFTSFFDFKKELLWPVYFDHEQNKFIDGGLEEEFFKSIQGIPGKARHNRLHLVIFARLPPGWAEVVLRVIRLALAMRYTPMAHRDTTRNPIPKSTPGETRPITLVHDGFGFQSSFIGNHLQNAMERCNAFLEETIAFRAGKGCDDITHLILAMKEDAIEFLRLFLGIFEDEEKFYDRVLAELQAIALRVFGCPRHGYVEFKIDEMHLKRTTVKTRQGWVLILYLVGLLQGSRISCTMANPVTAFKFQAWKQALGEKLGYKMACQDERDITTTEGKPFTAAGYCDDNACFFGQPTPPADLAGTAAGRRWALQEVIERAQAAIRATGDLSLITKLGRKGSKSEIHILNAHPDDMDLIPEYFESVAWLFMKDGILLSHVSPLSAQQKM